MSFAAGFTAGLAVGRKKFGGGGAVTPLSDMGTLKAIVDSNPNLKIVLTDNADVPTLSDYNYSYVSQAFTESVTTSTSDGQGETTTSVKSWSADVIKQLRDNVGKAILTAHFADDKGTIDYYTDKNGQRVYLGEGYLDE